MGIILNGLHFITVQSLGKNKVAVMTLIACLVMLVLEARQIQRGDGSWFFVVVAGLAIVLACAQIAGFFSRYDR